MNKIERLLSDRRDRKLRERLLYHFNSPFCAALAFIFIKTGKINDYTALWGPNEQEYESLFATLDKRWKNR